MLVRNGQAPAMVAGLDSVIERLQQALFASDAPLALPEAVAGDRDFVGWLRGLRFPGEVWALPEGRRAAPGEPLLALYGPAPLAPLLLPAVCHLLELQMTVATHFARLALAAGGCELYEGGEGGPTPWAVRAAYVGGARGCARAAAAGRFGLPLGPSAPPVSAPELGDLVLFGPGELNDERLRGLAGAPLEVLWLLWPPRPAELLRARELIERHGTDDTRLCLQGPMTRVGLADLPLAEAAVTALVASAAACGPTLRLQAELELSAGPIPMEVPLRGSAVGGLASGKPDRGTLFPLRAQRDPSEGARTESAPGLVRVLHGGRLAAALPNLHAIRECALRAAAEAPL